MKMRFIQDEGGQALIQVSIAIIVLLGFAALAIDVSFGYSQRRDMQNAADAGALAGAYELCFASQDEDRAREVAEEYATERNRAQLPFATPVIAGGLITVTTQRTEPTFLAGVIGFPEITTGATAVAACGAATSGCGFLPMAFQISEWQKAVSECPTEREIWIFDGDKEVNCVDYNCDFNGDGKNDVISGPHRAWMDFSTALDSVVGDPCENKSSGCGNSELICRIQSDYAPKITLPACVAGKPGAPADAFTPPNKESPLAQRIGDIVRVPLYNGYCGSESGTGGGSCQSGLYKVESFGCVEITDVLFNEAFGGPGEKYNIVKAKVLCDGCSTTCGSTDGTPPVPGGLRAVNLTK